MNHLEDLKLYMVLLGANPPGRRVEQHDFFFGIAPGLEALLPQFKSFWPEAIPRLHIDAWREVNAVDGYRVHIVQRTNDTQVSAQQENKLFFVNLGGYKHGRFEEQHEVFLIVRKHKQEAFDTVKSTDFFRTHHITAKAASHIDNKYGLDVDELYHIDEMLSTELKSRYQIELIPHAGLMDDTIHLGYYPLFK